MSNDYDYYSHYPSYDCHGCDCECYAYDEPEEDCECHCHLGYDEEYDSENDIDGVGFADPGGHSALRAATRDNPRDCPCPTCGAENILTRIDRERGYQCDGCANDAECGW